MVAADKRTSGVRDVVVFVDDQPEILSSLRRLLRDETYEVRTTTSPDEALRWVGAGDVSVLVTDERMPTMRGTDLLERASKSSPRTVRVVLTGYPGSYTLHYGLSHGVDWLISKPWNDEALRLTVRQLIEDRRRSRRPQERLRTPRDFQEICETFGLPLLVVEARGEVVWSNPALLDLVGRPRSEVVGRPLSDLFSDPAAAGPVVERLAREAPIRELEARLLRKDGSAFQAVLDADHLGGQGALLRIRAREAGESDESFRLLAEGLKDAAIFMLDPRGDVARWNAGAEGLLGYRADEILGRPFSTFFAEERAAETLLRRAAETGELRDEGWRRRKDGTSYAARDVVTALRDAGNGLRGYAVVTRDMTEARRLDDALLRGEKLRALGRLSAGIAHEINTPVGYILSNVSTMREYVDDLVRLVRAGSEAAEKTRAGAPAQEAFAAFDELRRRVDFDFIAEDFASAARDSRQGAERIRDLVKSLRDFARADEDPVKPLDLLQVLEEALKISWNELKYKVEIERDVQPLPPVPGSPQRMEQVFVNLLLNAGQAIPKKGTIRLSSRVEDGFAVVRIKDTGVGMAPDVLHRIFEPSGGGIGLQVARRIVEALGGRIEAASEPGRGSEFSVKLPLGPGDAGRSAP